MKSGYRFQYKWNISSPKSKCSKLLIYYFSDILSSMNQYWNILQNFLNNKLAKSIINNCYDCCMIAIVVCHSESMLEIDVSMFSKVTINFIVHIKREMYLICQKKAQYSGRIIFLNCFNCFVVIRC